MDVVIGQLFTGLSIGSILLLAALGLSLTFGQMGVINMAHGEFIMAGSYTAYVVQQVVSSATGSLFISLLVGFVVGGAMGVLLEVTLVKRMYHRPLDTLLVTFGVGLILQQLARDVFGAPAVNVAAPGWLSGGVEILGAVVPKTRLFILVLAVVAVVALSLAMQKSSMGRRIRAVVQNRDLAETSGISSRRTDVTTFFIGSGLAGVAGVALTLIGSTSPTIGQSYLIDAFLVVVVGGLGQMKGAVIAAFALGILNSFVEYSTTRRSPRSSCSWSSWCSSRFGRRACSPSRRGVSYEHPDEWPLPRAGGIRAGRAASVRSRPAVLSDFRLSLLGKFLCFAIVAVGIGLAWGRGGMLTLGQGVFFGLGAYMMAMHLKIADAELRGDTVPDFMQIAGIRELPGYWVPFTSPIVTILGILLVPASVAFVLGLGVFKRRVKGAYFAILSQALAAAFAILLVGQQSTGGSNGLNRFRTFFGFNLNDPANKQMLFFIAAGVLLAVVAVTRQLMNSRYGELLVAVRDQEERVRFLGYDPANIKLVAYVTAAFFAGLAGALFVPIVGIISPADVGIVPSIAFLIGVAIGGRATLLGPVLGAIGVAWAQSAFSESFPSGWIYAQGLLFIVVVGFFPAGVAGLFALLKRKQKAASEQQPRPGPEDETEAAERMEMAR